MRFLKYKLIIVCLLLLAVGTSVAGRRENGTPAPQPAKSAMALYMDSLGLVNVAELDSSLAVELMYTRADNFTGEVLYDNMSEAYLHPDAAYALVKAQRRLKELHPSYSLLIYDAARPMSVQKKMWNVVKGTSRYKYVSNPSRGGGLHNYGLAVDVSIRDSLGKPLPMGTKVDHLGIEAHITRESELVRNGKISETERQNRLLLRKVMKEAGFRALPSEWWHFNFCSREVAKQKYKVIP
ncbi:M15 family metallopeptidase [uncultured Bacteroides sp.]|uniref:M15 family metallopeptidase n=1 Tax=uncultured Bacteroides sp. TaxID=162156 RepID=UPI0025E1A3A0|nr:M15 family metallopeptidase [uncultured Bacteroides sp.]